MQTTKKIALAPDHQKITVTTEELQAMLSCGRKTAVDIGTLAGARVQIGKRVLWNVEKVNAYINLISS